MSNTGFKNITDMEPYGEPYLRVSVQWRHERVVVYVPKSKYKDPIKHALNVRNSIERLLGKPRTEVQIRSSGIFHKRLGTGSEIEIIEWNRR